MHQAGALPSLLFALVVVRLELPEVLKADGIPNPRAVADLLIVDMLADDTLSLDPRVNSVEGLRRRFVWTGVP